MRLAPAPAFLAPSPRPKVQGLVPEALADLAGVPLADARRILSASLRAGALPEKASAGFRRASLEAVRAASEFGRLEVASRRASAVDPFVKFALRLEDGALVEAVRIPLEKPGRFSVCVSSQVGCALACAFCATGRMGLSRNLEAWEIVEQVRLVAADLAGGGSPGGRVHGVLFQGMGEPLANVERVVAAARALREPSGLAIDLRNVTVCTAGLPSGIRRLARDLPDARLGLSLGSLRPGARRSLMPIDDAHPLEEVLEAAAEHAVATRQAPLFAYAMLADVNDAEEDAARLARLATDFAEKTGIRPRLSLIPCNPIEGEPFSRSPDERLEAFRAVLRARGVGAIVRYSGGGDVGAACGQLATISRRPDREPRKPRQPGEAPVDSPGAPR